MRLFILLLLFLSFSVFGQITQVGNLSKRLYGVEFYSSTEGYVVGPDGIYFSSDGGANWNEISGFLSINDSISYENSQFYSASESNGRMFVCGQDTVNNTAIILRKITSSNPWERIYTGPANSKLVRIHSSVNKKCAVGDHGLIVHSSDNDGDTWSVETTSYTNNWKSVHAYSSTFAVTGEGLTITGPVGAITNVMNNSDLADIFMNLNNSFGVGGDTLYRGTNVDNVEPSINYLTGGTNVAVYGNHQYVGSENGIYYSLNSGVFGLVSSTVNYKIAEIDFSQWGSGFAIDSSGVVLQFGTLGVDSYIPYVGFTAPNGACTDSLFTCNNLGENWGVSHNWYIDGVHVSNAFNLSTSINTPGTHVIKLVTTDGQQDSLEINFEVVDLPEVLFNLTSSDTILCQSGNVDVVIDSSDIQSEYKLYNLSNNTVLSAAVGNGGSLTLNTGILTDTTFLGIGVVSTLADCEIMHPDTINILVEQPKALFTPTFINAHQNTPIFIGNQSINSVSYDWNFVDPDASIPSSVLNTPTVAYSAIGEKTIQLIATAEFGCTDTLTKLAVNIYSNDGLYKKSWAQKIRDTVNFNTSAEGIIVDENDFVYVNGQTNFETMPSKIGWTHQSKNKGGYFARYDSDGVLNWYGQVTSPNNYPTVSDLVVDSNNEIYITGKSPHVVMVNEPDGDSVLYADSESIPLRFLSKLDSLGNVKWQSFLRNGWTGDEKIAVDDLGNVYMLLAEFGGNYSIDIINSDSTIFTSDTVVNRWLRLVKWNSNGIVEWSRSIESSGGSSTSSNLGLDIDLNGNVVVGYHFGNNGIFSSSSNQSQSIDCPYCPITSVGTEVFICQYDSNGDLQWLNTIYAKHDGSNPNYDSRDALVDLEVNKTTGDIMVLTNPDTKQDDGRVAIETSAGIETFFHKNIMLSSFNSQGQLNWSSGWHSQQQDLSIIARCTAIASDYDGNTHVSGYFHGTSNFNFPTQGEYLSADSTINNINVRAYGFWVAKVDSLGFYKDIFYENGDSINDPLYTVENKEMSYDSDNNIYITGNISGYDAIIAADSISVNSNQNPYFAKFDSTGGTIVYIDGIINSNVLCIGDTSEIYLETDNTVPLNGANIYTCYLLGDTDSLLSGDTLGTLLSSQYSDTIQIVIPNNTPSGTYAMYLTSSNGFAFGFVDSVQVEQPPVGNTLDYSVCQGISVQLSAQSGFSYSWEPPSGLSNDSSQTVNAQPTNSIQYIVDIAQNCGIVSDTFNINVSIPDSTITITGDTIICSGESTLLTANGGNNYSWNTGATSTSIIVNPAIQTTYTVEGIDIATNCPIVDSVAIEVNAIPDVNTSLSNQTLSAIESGNGITYQWIDCNSGSILLNDTLQSITMNSMDNYAVIVSNSFCQDTSQCVTYVETQIGESSLSGIYIYPTPAKDFITVKTSNQRILHVEIYALDGKLIYAEEDIEEHAAINLSGFNSGVYVVSVKTSESEYFQRIIKL